MVKEVMSVGEMWVLLEVLRLPVGVFVVIDDVLFARQHHHRVVYPVDDGSVMEDGG